MCAVFTVIRPRWFWCCSSASFPSSRYTEIKTFASVCSSHFHTLTNGFVCPEQSNNWSIIDHTNNRCQSFCSFRSNLSRITAAHSVSCMFSVCERITRWALTHVIFSPAFLPVSAPLVRLCSNKDQKHFITDSSKVIFMYFFIFRWLPAFCHIQVSNQLCFGRWWSECIMFLQSHAAVTLSTLTIRNALSQLVLQSYNAAFNHANRNSSSEQVSWW